MLHGDETPLPLAVRHLSHSMPGMLTPDTEQRHAEESVLLRQAIARLEGEKAALLEHMDEAEEERAALKGLVESADASAARAQSEAGEAAAGERRALAEAEACRVRVREHADEAVRARRELEASQGAQQELMAALRDAQADLGRARDDAQQAGCVMCACVCVCVCLGDGWRRLLL